VAGSDLAFALELSELADSVSLPRFRAADLRVETKADLTPVTDADLAVERALREHIAAERPGDTVLGEEQGDDGGRVRWIIDPIDGTRNFSRGLPVWATLLALERDGELVCGVVSAPALGHRWWAARGEGAWRDGEPIHVSRISKLGDAAVSCSEGVDLAAFEPHVWHARGLGDFWQHVLVAEGALDAAVDSPLAIWDYAAVAVIVHEAGGRAGAPDGGSARPKEQLVSTNGVVHDAVLRRLSGA
jgi:histidinol-phosphatase